MEQRRPVGVPNEDRLVAQPHRVAVPVQHPILERPAADVVAHLRHLGQDAIAIIRVQPGFPQPLRCQTLLRGVSKYRLVLGTHVQRRRRRPELLDVGDGRDLLGERLELRGRVPQSLLRELPVGDVAGHALPEQRLSVVVTNQERFVVYPRDGAVPADDSIVHRERLAGRGGMTSDLDRSLAILGMKDLRPEVRIGHPLLDRVPEDLLVAAAHELGDVRGFGPGAVEVDDRGHLLDESTEPRDRLLERRLVRVFVRHVREDADPAPSVDVVRRLVPEPVIRAVGDTRPVRDDPPTVVRGSLSVEGTRIVGMDEARPETGIVEVGVGRVAEGRLGLRPEPDHRRRSIGGDVRDDRELGDRCVELGGGITGSTHHVCIGIGLPFHGASHRAGGRSS